MCKLCDLGGQKSRKPKYTQISGSFEERRAAPSSPLFFSASLFKVVFSNSVASPNSKATEVNSCRLRPSPSSISAHQSRSYSGELRLRPRREPRVRGHRRTPNRFLSVRILNQPLPLKFLSFLSSLFARCLLICLWEDRYPQFVIFHSVIFLGICCYIFVLLILVWDVEMDERQCAE